MKKISVDVSSISAIMKKHNLTNGVSLFYALVKGLRIGVPLYDETNEPEPDGLPEQFEKVVEIKNMELPRFRGAV